ncbi:MAG: MoxR family ATPase [Gammaproteobacteria bacterium]|nr:MoxR family ATPase [Gammaproteobacteria bacterium]
MRPRDIQSILEKEFQSAVHGHHTPVMLWGPPGVGKSQLVAQVAQRHTASMIDIRLSQLEPSDLRGIPFRDHKRVEWAVPTMLPHEDIHGEHGILFLDEITSAPPSISAAAYQLILDRRLGDYRVPPGWAIFAAGNRQGDRGVSYAMPAPLANRFSHFEVETHLDDWALWAYENEIDERVIAFLRFRPEHLFEFDPAQNPIAFPTPRSWEFAHRALQKFSDSPSLLNGALQACVGPAAGIEINAFIDNLQDLPDIDAIIAGEETSVPEKVDLQYAVATALVGRAIKASKTDQAKTVIGRVLNYALNFPQKEMGVMLVSDLQSAVGDIIFEIPEFDQWADAVAEVMLYTEFQ